MIWILIWLSVGAATFLGKVYYVGRLHTGDLLISLPFTLVFWPYFTFWAVIDFVGGVSDSDLLTKVLWRRND